MGKEERAKVLKFERNAEFHYMKSQKQADDGKYIDSLVSLRSALKLEPDNREYALALAELYTEMDYFEESNDLYFSLLKDRAADYGEILFGMGCNFFGLRDVEKAKECFENYLSVYPGGEYVEDIRDFNEALAYDIMSAPERFPEAAYEKADGGKRLLDAGRYREAIEVLTGILKEYGDIQFVKNNLALAYFCVSDYERAKSLAREVLKEDGDNVHANCNLALMALSEGNEEELSEYEEALLRLTGVDADENIKLGLTCCELGLTERAYSLFQEALTEIPYDSQTLFFSAAAAANLGRPQEALKIFLNMLKLRPEDSVALYYKNYVQKAIEKKENVRIDYSYQVPVEEVKKRMTYLTRTLQKTPRSELPALFKDERFRSTLLWGIETGSEGVKHTLLNILGEIGGEEAEQYLKSYLLKRDEPDEVKETVFLALRKTSAEPPYIAYIKGKISEVNIGMVDTSAGELTGSHHKVVDMMIAMAGKGGGDLKRLLPRALEGLVAFVQSQEKPKSMRNVYAWAAAFLYAAANEKEKEDLPAFAKKVDAEENSLLRCYKEIEKSGIWN